MVYRVYVEKKKELANEAKALSAEYLALLGEICGENADKYAALTGTGGCKK